MSQTYGLSSDSMSSDAVVAGTGAGARDSKERLELESDAEERLELESAAEDEGSWSHQLMVELGCHRGEENIKAVYDNMHIIMHAYQVYSSMFHYLLLRFHCFLVNLSLSYSIKCFQYKDSAHSRGTAWQ